jgi:hypothetical protein
MPGTGADAPVPGLREPSQGTKTLNGANCVASVCNTWLYEGPNAPKRVRQHHHHDQQRPRERHSERDAEPGRAIFFGAHDNSSKAKNVSADICCDKSD